MGYPALSLDAAQELESARRLSNDPLLDFTPTWKTGPDFREETAEACLDRCWGILEECVDERRSTAEFDSACAPVVHRLLSLPVAIACDPDFWRWLTFGRHCDGARIVDRRYGGGRGRLVGGGETQKARPVYYGLGPMKKGMFAKLWICANLMYVEGASDPYDGIEYADVDLWDSHVIDVDYGSAPSVARAFVRIVRDLNLPRGTRRPDTPAGYRDLAKELRRRHASVALELFMDAKAYEWVKAVWQERELWHRS